MEIAPSAFLGARITFSMSLVIAVVSEMIFTPRSGLAIGSLAKRAFLPQPRHGPV
jgi:ABC-type nitrate/sulfonate/bicarbonate transport system permease component